MSDFEFPQVAPVIRPNGDSVVELRQGGEVIGELNFTKIIGLWFDRLGLLQSRPKPRHLTIVP